MVFNLYTAGSVTLNHGTLTYDDEFSSYLYLVKSKYRYVDIVLNTKTYDDEFSSCLYLGRSILLQVEEGACKILG